MKNKNEERITTRKIKIEHQYEKKKCKSEKQK